MSRFRFRGLLLAVLLSGGFVQTTQAVVLVTNDLATNNGDEYVEYLGVTGVLTQRNAPFRLVVPENWNGTLLVYSRGTGSAIVGFDTSLGFPIPRVGGTPLANVPPVPGVSNGVPGVSKGDNELLEDRLIEDGFAFIASDYKPDPRFLEDGLLGWVVEDGIRDTRAATLEAQLLLWLKHGQVDRTILWGRSQGSLAVLKLLRQNPFLYDAGITGCTVGAGAPRSWDLGIQFALAFDVAFGWDNQKWGNVKGGNVPENISFADDVLPTLQALLQDPANFARFEFIRLVNRLPLEGFYPTPGYEEFNWLGAAMNFLTEVRGDLESKAKAGGQVGQNKDHVYTLLEEDVAYLSTLGLEPTTQQELLDGMNRRTVFTANPKARDYAESFADVSGELGHKVLSIHTTKDGLVIPENESAFLVRVEDAGKEENLVQAYASATSEGSPLPAGHCNFTVDQWDEALAEMDEWLGTGVKPDPSAFPSFDPAFAEELGPWPQPTP